MNKTQATEGGEWAGIDYVKRSRDKLAEQWGKETILAKCDIFAKAGQNR